MLSLRITCLTPMCCTGADYGEQYPHQGLSGEPIHLQENMKVHMPSSILPSVILVSAIFLTFSALDVLSFVQLPSNTIYMSKEFLVGEN